MGSLPFKPQEIDLVTFDSHSIKTLPKNKQINKYIKQNFSTNRIKKRKKQQISNTQTWEFVGRDLTLTNMTILFQSLRQVKFETVILKQLQDYEFVYFAKNQVQVNIMKKINLSSFYQLKFLAIHYCSITSIQGLSFLQAPNLTSLDISYNPITNMKALNKCNWTNLIDINVQHNFVRQTYYLNNLTRCNLNKYMQVVNLDRSYIKVGKIKYDPLQKQKQSIDLRPMFKWNCVGNDHIMIRQAREWNNWDQQGIIMGYEVKIRQKIRQKYKNIYIEICYQQMYQYIL